MFQDNSSIETCHGQEGREGREWEGVSQVLVEILLSQSNSSVFQKFSDIKKNFTHKRDLPRFSVENLLYHSPEKNPRGTVLSFKKPLVSKKFMDMMGRRDGFSITIFVESLLWQSTEKLSVLQNISSMETFQRKEGREGGLEGSITISCGEFVVSQNQKTFGVSEVYRYRKIVCTGGVCHGSLSNDFCLTVPKTFFMEPFDVPEFFKHRKCSCIGGITFFQWAVLCPTVPKNVIWETFCFSKNFSIFNFKKYGWEGWGLRFPSNFFVSHYRKAIMCFRKVLVSRKFMVKNGGGREYHDFPSKVCCFTIPKKIVEALSVFPKVSGIEKFMYMRGRRNGWGITVFRRQFVVSQYRKISQRKTFGFSENFGYRKFLCIGAFLPRFSVENLLYHSPEKIPRGTISSLKKHLVSKKIMDMMGRREGFSITSCRRKFVVTKYRKTFCVAEYFFHRNVSRIREEKRGRSDYHDFLSRIYCLTVPKNLQCFRSFRLLKSVLHKRGLPRVSVENLLSQSTEKNPRGTILSFKKPLVSKEFTDKGWCRQQVLRFSVTIFLSHNADKSLGGTLLCFRKLRVSKKFMHLCIRGIGHDSLSKVFCLTVPKMFIAELFLVSEKFFYRNFFMD